MKALLLAAGLGTRLKPFTNETPKCLTSIGGRPYLDILLEQLSGAGIGPFLINTHHLADQVSSYVKNCAYRSQIELVNEPELLGTAGTLLKNIDFFDGEDGMVMHADNYNKAFFEKFISAHKKRPSVCLMTMMLFEAEKPSECGIVEIDKDGVVINFHEKVKHPPGTLANGAIYVMDAICLELIKNKFKGANDISIDILPRMLGKIYTYKTHGIFIDIGTPENLKKINEIECKYKV